MYACLSVIVCVTRCVRVEINKGKGNGRALKRSANLSKPRPRRKVLSLVTVKHLIRYTIIIIQKLGVEVGFG